jgi:hypothetical protein
MASAACNAGVFAITCTSLAAAGIEAIKIQQRATDIARLHRMQIRWTTPIPPLAWSIRRSGDNDIHTRLAASSQAYQMPVFNAHSSGIAASSVPFSRCREQPRIVVVIIQTDTDAIHSYESVFDIIHSRCYFGSLFLSPVCFCLLGLRLMFACRYRSIAQLMLLPRSIDVLFFGGSGAHLLLHALHIALAEFDDAGYFVVMSDAAIVHADRILAYVESRDLSSCQHVLSYRPHFLSSSILNDPVFTENSGQSSLSASSFASLDDGFLVTRSLAEAVLAERRRWLQVGSAGV